MEYCIGAYGDENVSLLGGVGGHGLGGVRGRCRIESGLGGRRRLGLIEFLGLRIGLSDPLFRLGRGLIEIRIRLGGERECGERLDNFRRGGLRECRSGGVRGGIGERDVRRARFGLLRLRGL